MYSQTWNKYLPVIRILLKRSATAPQQTGLNKTDFETGGSRTRKLSCSFTIYPRLRNRNRYEGRKCNEDGYSRKYFL
jgi:hypothetical protein